MYYDSETSTEDINLTPGLNIVHVFKKCLPRPQCGNAPFGVVFGIMCRQGAALGVGQHMQILQAASSYSCSHRSSRAACLT